MSKPSRMYRVVSIAKNIGSYPECAADTAAFPHLVKHLENEQELFIIEADDPTVFYPASEFFYILSGMVEGATFMLMLKDAQPPDLGISVSDGVKAADRVGG